MKKIYAIKLSVALLASTLVHISIAQLPEMTADINPTGGFNSDNSYVTLNGSIYFVADDGTHGL